MKRFFHCCLAVLLGLLLFSPTITLACGPFMLSAVFIHTAHPSYPMENFAGGAIGVVQPSYARSYLVVAYRHLNDAGFDQQEQGMLTELWKDRLNYGWQVDYQEWTKSWLQARQQVAGLNQPPEIDVYRQREPPNQYETFLNCQKDAFENAINALNARVAKYGASAPSVKSWVEAQDVVFSNCRAGAQIPASAESSADALIRADREYQIAAANFYAANFDEATRRFDAIAQDSISPWQLVAPYLAARSLIRKASLSDKENKAEPLSRAEQRLIKIISDKTLAGSHEASGRLLNLVRLRLRPSERLHELAQKLTTTNNSSLKQDLWDYTVLLDGFLESGESENAKLPEDARIDDLTDWLVTFQSNSRDSLVHSLDKWNSTRSLAWLIAALSKLQGNDTNVEATIAEALKVGRESAAFPSARFHVVRLLIESGKRNEARRLLEDSLTNVTFDESTQNLLLSQRMQLANNLAEFLASAPRLPAALSWNDDGRELPAEDSEISPETKAARGKRFFDEDAVTAFNKFLPLSVLKEAAKSDSLPAHLRRDLAQAVWLRAVLLDDFKTADELTPILKSLTPELSGMLDRFTATKSTDTKKFAGLFMWLKTPGLEPVVDVGLGRETALTEQDQYRDNWWCTAAFPASTTGFPESEESPTSFTAGNKTAPSFLSNAESAAATRESATINSFGAAPNYLTRQVIQYANSNPTDPRIPEALHRVVNSTRYGCTDKETGRWSKAAFDLLHRRYANTTWAKRTKYWFKD